MAPPSSSLRRFLSLARIPLALLGVALFFTVYNRFILDANLRNLESSLGVLDRATGVGQAEAALLLVHQTLEAEVAREEIHLEGVVALQYAQGTLSSEEADRPVDDAQALVEKVAEERRSARSGILAALDGVVAGAQSTFHRLATLPRRREKGPDSQEMDAARLHQAVLLERRGRFPEAASVYEELLRDYPAYRDQGTLQLRLGHLRQRLRSFDKAEAIYRKLIRTSRRVEEIAAAQKMLARLLEAQGAERKALALEKRLGAMGSGPDRQRAGFRLGNLWIKGYRMDRASEAFQAAAGADPEGEWAIPCLFKRGWALRSDGKLEEALQAFREVIGRDPTGPWGTAARLQIAEAQRASGQLREAMETYEQALKESESPPFLALALAQAGCTALFDLNDSAKAKAYFDRLAAEFPASPLSAIEKDLSRLQQRKATLWGPAGQPLTAGMPLFGLAQRMLPVFVRVFAERLAKYMDAVGETESVRKYTEEEFQRLVFKRVQELFPGKMEGVAIRIRPEGYVGSGTVRLGLLSFPLEGRVAIRVVNDRPHVIIHEMRVWKIPVIEPLREKLAAQVNQAIDKLRLPIRVKEYETREGHCWIKVERVQ